MGAMSTWPPPGRKLAAITETETVFPKLKVLGMRVVAIRRPSVLLEIKNTLPVVLGADNVQPIDVAASRALSSRPNWLFRS